MKRWLILAVCVIFLAPPAFGQVVVDEIIAKVNEDIILRSYLSEQERLVRQEAQTMIAAGQPAAEVQAAVELELEHLLRNLIDESLLVQKATEYGIDTEAALQVLRTFDQIREQNGFETTEDLEAAIIAQGDSPEAVRDSIRKQYLSEQVKNQEIRSRIVITSEELRAYYDEHRDEFDRPRGVNLAEIVKPIGGLPPEEADRVRAEMEEILARLRDGEDFFEIAVDESESSTAPNGGILGYFGDGDLGPEFEEAANRLRRNEISDIFQVGDYLVIIKLLERHEGGILSFESARRELEAMVMAEREGPRIREYLNRLRQDGFVWVREGYVDTGAVESQESDTGVE